MKNNQTQTECQNYHRTQMQRQMVIDRLRERGCRITKQRLQLLDIILEEECAGCKEIYIKAASVDNRIGLATVYRMINLLEEIGAISRKNMYKIACEKGGSCDRENVCMLEFDDDTSCGLSAKQWNEVLAEGLRRCGYLNGKHIRNVSVFQCEC